MGDFQAKSGGAWSKVQTPYVKQGSVWTPAQALYGKQNGAWTKLWPNEIIFDYQFSVYYYSDKLGSYYLCRYDFPGLPDWATYSGAVGSGNYLGFMWYSNTYYDPQMNSWMPAQVAFFRSSSLSQIKLNDANFKNNFSLKPGVTIEVIRESDMVTLEPQRDSSYMTGRQLPSAGGNADNHYYCLHANGNGFTNPHWSLNGGKLLPDTDPPPPTNTPLMDAIVRIRMPQ